MLPGDGIRLAATKWSGTGTPVLLLHGLASQRRFWNLVVPRLAGLPVLAVDLRGHGDSDQPADGYATRALVADLVPALDAVGWDRVVVVGHSWGALVALSLAAYQPHRALAAVAVDGGFAVAPPAAELPGLRRRLAPPALAAAPADLPRLLAVGPLAPYWSPEVADAVLPIFGVGTDGLARARLPFEQHMQALDEILAHQPEPVFRALRCPTWLVSCEPVDDPAGSEEWSRRKITGLQLAARSLRTARLLRWAGAVHDVPLQWPALVAGLVHAAVADAVTARPEREEPGR